MTIYLEDSATCWTATCQGSDVMPNGEPLPLPFTRDCSICVVADDLRRRFPGARVVSRNESGNWV